MVVLGTACVWAQSDAPVNGLTLVEAVNDALNNYPSIRVTQEQMNAAAAGIQLARTAYLPRMDLLAQFNRATRNNVFGMLLPQSVIPSMSGPVLGTNNGGAAWGSATGILVTWEPFDFGAREANVAAADAARAAREATVKRTQFDVSVAAADAYVTLVATKAAVSAAQAGVDRAAVLARTIKALVNSQLRPGADASRADAELAAAQTELIQGQQSADIARANLARFTGLDPGQIVVTGEGLLVLAPERQIAQFNVESTPQALEQHAAVEQVRAQLKILERSYFPRFYLQGAAYARGSGADVNGAIQGGLNGLAPTTQDYALGFSVTFPVFDKPSIKAREAEQTANMRAEQARSQQLATDLRARWNTAVATLEGARKVAANTPLEVAAARAATNQANARYKAGLTSVDDVAEAQRLLTQSEIDEALARLNVWRALLGVAAVSGDIQPFLAEAAP